MAGTGARLTPERWTQVFAAADQALELGLEDREAFLEQCSVSDPILATEIRALLARGQRESALDKSASTFVSELLGDLASQPDSVGSQKRIGPYRIVGLIGRGGMGVV